MFAINVTAKAGESMLHGTLNLPVSRKKVWKKFSPPFFQLKIFHPLFFGKKGLRARKSLSPSFIFFRKKQTFFLLDHVIYYSLINTSRKKFTPSISTYVFAPFFLKEASSPPFFRKWGNIKNIFLFNDLGIASKIYRSIHLT